MIERRNVLEIMIGAYELLRRSQTRINLLFTMSEIPHAHPAKDATCEVMFRGRYLQGLLLKAAAIQGSAVDLQFHLVEPDGIEPTTSCLQSPRSPS